MLPVFVLWTLLCCFIVIGITFVSDSMVVNDAIIGFWGRSSCRLFGVRVVVEGRENIPATGFLYVFSHASYFDIYAMAGWLGHIRFGAKIELFKIPFFGTAMTRLGMLPISRGRREEVLKIYEKSEVRIRQGERFALAPEGTRQDSDTLGSFKSGPFVFAIRAKAPIVPVVIKGASEVLHKDAIVPNLGAWQRTIVIKILPPVATDNLTIEQRPQLQEKVRLLMADYFPVEKAL